MAELNKEEMLRVVEDNIQKMENKSFNVFFFVIDTKGNPSGSLEYIYRTALTLKELGYNVAMLHQEEEFIGVRDWLGEAAADLPHHNIEKENVEISACDFLFIPEILSSVMSQTKTLPCKRVIILQNHSFMADFMPVGVTPFDMNINEVVTTTKALKDIADEYFPGIKTHIVRPMIAPVFRNNDNPKKLIINVVSRSQDDISRIVKPFYWKYPIYKWVSFRDLRGVTQEVFADALREGAITIWLDEISDFGYSALEAAKSGSIVIAKVPATPTDWTFVYEESEDGKSASNGLNPAFIWFDDIRRVPDMVASVVRTWTLDKIPQELYDNLSNAANDYNYDAHKADVEKEYGKELFEKRLSDFKEVLAQIKNNKLTPNDIK
jgi:hypothetical protein